MKQTIYLKDPDARELGTTMKFLTDAGYTCHLSRDGRVKFKLTITNEDDVEEVQQEQ